jgi:hypothetical protein
MLPSALVTFQQFAGFALALHLFVTMIIGCWKAALDPDKVCPLP